jgi:hypothetical protein
VLAADCGVPVMCVSGEWLRIGVAGTVLALKAASVRGRKDETDAIEFIAAVTSTKESHLSVNVELQKRLVELLSSPAPPLIVVISAESDSEFL